MADGSPGIGHNGGPTLLEQNKQLVAKLAEFAHDPLGFVMWAFPWGVPGSALADESGPEEWQEEDLDEVGRRLRKSRFTPIQMQAVSGHGVGKSARMCWMILWAIMTRYCTRGVVTANTDTQLRTKTWAELAKWHALLAVAHPLLAEQFEVTATAIYAKGKDRSGSPLDKRWRIDAIPWSERNVAAFQGLHNKGIRTFIGFDEASGIVDLIWDAASGATTDAGTEIVWIAQGNPTENTGRFKENAEGKFRQYWATTRIDARSVRMSNKEQLRAWIDAWGIDSDFSRIRITGHFPRLGSMQLISLDKVQAARTREAFYIPSDPLIAGLDIARYGDDQSVLAPRRGRDARSIPWQRWRDLDLMNLAGEVSLWCEQWKPDALFVDVSGMGVGVYDRLLQLRVPNVFPTEFGSKGRLADMNGTEVRTANLRAAIWCAMNGWLEYGSIPDQNEIEQDLIGTQYGFNGDNAIILEEKAHMKARGLASPDNGDALACTFTWPIAPRGLEDVTGLQLIPGTNLGKNASGDLVRVPNAGMDKPYNPYGDI